jgi:predicted DNA-binding protein (UPF0251 family)
MRAISFTAKGYGPAVDLRITKKEGGVPISLVPEGTPGARVVAVKRVNELDFYNLGHNQLAEKVALTPPKLTALRRFMQLDEDEECFKEIAVGKARHKRYSQKAIEKIEQALAEGVDMDEVWRKCGPHRSGK